MSNIKDSTIDSLCDKKRNDLMEMESPYFQEMRILIDRFDTISEEIISDNMCTDRCPCLNYTFDDGYMKSNSKLKYDMVLEEHMNKY